MKLNFQESYALYLPDFWGSLSHWVWLLPMLFHSDLYSCEASLLEETAALYNQKKINTDYYN